MSSRTSFGNMMWKTHFGVAIFVLLVAAVVAKPQSNPRKDGNIDSISAATSFSSLDPAAIQRFLNNEKSVNTLARCYQNRPQCTSASSLNLMNQIAGFQASGGQCSNCDPGVQQKTVQMLAMLIKGLSENYPQQWQVIFPHIRVLVQALQQKG